MILNFNLAPRDRRTSKSIDRFLEADCRSDESGKKRRFRALGTLRHPVEE